MYLTPFECMTVIVKLNNINDLLNIRRLFLKGTAVQSNVLLNVLPNVLSAGYSIKFQGNAVCNAVFTATFGKISMSC
jgi:hypothetical protein